MKAREVKSEHRNWTQIGHSLYLMCVATKANTLPIGSSSVSLVLHLRVHCATQRENHVSSERSQSTWTSEQTEQFKVHHTGTLGGYKGKHAHYQLRKCPSANTGATEGQVNVDGNVQVCSGTDPHSQHPLEYEWVGGAKHRWLSEYSFNLTARPYLKRSEYVLPVMLLISYTTPKHAQKKFFGQVFLTMNQAQDVELDTGCSRQVPSAP